METRWELLCMGNLKLRVTKRVKPITGLSKKCWDPTRKVTMNARNSQNSAKSQSFGNRLIHLMQLSKNCNCDA